VQSRDRDKELQSIGKKGQSIEEVNDLLWSYEDDITTKMEALSILCVCFYFHCSSIVHSLMQSILQYIRTRSFNQKNYDFSEMSLSNSLQSEKLCNTRCVSIIVHVYVPST